MDTVQGTCETVQPASCTSETDRTNDTLRYGLFPFFCASSAQQALFHGFLVKEFFSVHSAMSDVVSKKAIPYRASKTLRKIRSHSVSTTSFTTLRSMANRFQTAECSPSCSTTTVFALLQSTTCFSSSNVTLSVMLRPGI